jgi:hypothetical protein
MEEPMAMRWSRFASLVWVFLLAVQGWGQSSPGAVDPLWSPHPIQDKQAVQVVQSATNALGGAAAIQQLQNYVVQAQVLSTSRTFGTTGTATWTVMGTQYREDYPSAQGIKTLSSGNGKPFASVNGGNVTTVLPHVLRAEFAPALVAPMLLAELQGKNYSIQYGGTSQLDSETVTTVLISSQATRVDAAVTPQRWFFDSTSNLPVRIEYRLPDMKAPERTVPAAISLSGYQAISGVLFPTQAARWISGNQFDTLKLTSVQTNTNVTTSSFAAPGGAQ